MGIQDLEIKFSLNSTLFHGFNLDRQLLKRRIIKQLNYQCIYLLRVNKTFFTVILREKLINWVCQNCLGNLTNGNILNKEIPLKINTA